MKRPEKEVHLAPSGGRAVAPSPACPKTEAQGNPPPRKPYQKPRLVVFGDVRDSTFGASPGIGDSANPALLRP
ncbi:MAG: hypothetical protein AAF657_28955 [Acidobacteriota bacterium]